MLREEVKWNHRKHLIKTTEDREIGEKRKQQVQQIKIHDRYLFNHISVITLNVNGWNMPVKTQRSQSA